MATGAFSENELQNVITYQMATLAKMQNSCISLEVGNTEFIDFQSKTANLGDTVSYQLTPRFTVSAGLVPGWQGTDQRVGQLSCKNAYNIGLEYTDQQLLFNVDQYMEVIGEGKILEFSSVIERDLLTSFVSGFKVNNPRDPLRGEVANPYAGPYRFWGDGTTNFFTGFKDLQQGVTNFLTYGAAQNKRWACLPIDQVPQLIDNASTKFAPVRNDGIMNSWEIGRFGSTDWYQSNLLPVHFAGNVGEEGLTLTLTDWDDHTGQNITELTFTGANANDQEAVHAGDLFQFTAASKENWRTFSGRAPTNLPVQFRALYPAESNGSGVVVIKVTPSLSWVSNNIQNLTRPLAAGMQVTSVPTHQAGIIASGNQFYVAMPRMKDASPYASHVETDPDTGISMRAYYGFIVDQALHGFVNDAIVGCNLEAETCMRLIFPYTG